MQTKKTVLANELKESDVFRINPRGRKNFTVRKIHVLPEKMDRPEDRGKIIVFTHEGGCKQFALRPDREVIIIE